MPWRAANLIAAAPPGGPLPPAAEAHQLWREKGAMWGLERDIQVPEQQRAPEPRTAADAVTVQEVIDRIISEHDAEGRPSPVLNHAAPRGPITVEYARILMRQHRPCNRDECPAKRCAFALLVDKGIMFPSPSAGQLEPGRVRAS